jgi:oligopeptide/dipeptide ABC transporter ATP-binding protein
MEAIGRDDAGPLLDVRHLTVWNARNDPGRLILEDVSFFLGQRESVVVLGESGSGKTTLARAITRLFPENSGIGVSGAVSFLGSPIDDDAALSTVRRSMIRYVFQHPSRALNPTSRIRTQLRNALDGRRPTDEELQEILSDVGLQQPAEILDSYPHQLSVGMAQRVAIAMAIAPKPSLLIADEPTSALDASLRIHLLNLLRSIQRTRGTSMLLVTHNLEVARECADRIIVLYAGRIVESTGAREFFESPLHPYSRMVLSAQRTIEKGFPMSERVDETAESALPHCGCKFSPRCSLVQQRCRDEEPELETVDNRRMVRCFFWK